MPTLRDIRELRAALDVEGFTSEVGPFVLIRRPAEALELQALTRLAEHTTQVTTPGDRVAGVVALLLQFEEMEVLGVPRLPSTATARLGRLGDNDLVVDQQSVSKNHAELAWSRGRCVVRDLGSSNGTTVNRRKAEGAVELKDGDEVAFGDVRFAFVRTPSLWRALPQSAPATPQTSVPAASARREVVRLPDARSPAAAAKSPPELMRTTPPPRALRTFTPPPGLPAVAAAPAPAPVRAPAAAPPPPAPRPLGDDLDSVPTETDVSQVTMSEEPSPDHTELARAPRRKDERTQRGRKPRPPR